MASEDHLFIRTLPPAVDYVNYLILLEHNLSVENLPALHQVLQDSTLTVNIGWDLVHLLLPLLPASEECLHDIARLGNPREVVLKVVESLRLLDFDSVVDISDDEDDAAKNIKKLTIDIPSRSGDLTEPKRPLQVLQFQTLLEMLSTVQPRIKSKVPSRFLSATLQGVLASYSQASTHMDDLTAAVVKFAKTNSGTQRPHLPPRTSSGMLSNFKRGETAPDPEGQEGDVTEGEKAIQKRLMQSFVTHVLEDYLGAMHSDEDVPGLAWSARLMENMHPERKIPHRASFKDKFATTESLKSRSAITGQLVALAQDLNLDSEDLFKVMTEEINEPVSPTHEEDDPPETAEDIPLSRLGALYLFTARKVSENLYNTPATTPTIAIFPTHATLLNNFLNARSASTNAASIGASEHEATVDAILALGLVSLEANNVGEPGDDDAFTSYLQATSLLSANCPSPTLRFHAHYLTATVLRSHPSDIARLAFIRDTLEHCPFSNLRASAVGWLKGEIVDANVPSSLPPESSQDTVAATVTSPTTSVLETGAQSVFATPVALASVSGHLFPDVMATKELVDPGASSEAVATMYAQEAGFYLASLNFYLLLLVAQHVHEPLDIQGLRQNAKVDKGLVKGLRTVLNKLKEVGDADEQGQADVALLEGTLNRVEEAASRI